MDRPAARRDALFDEPFLIYFGTDRTYPDLAHHHCPDRAVQGIAGGHLPKKILADDFSLYLHAPTRTDPSLAPPGCECFYVLSPVPNLGGKVDWNAVKEVYADAILESLEKLCPDLRRHIVSKLIWTPLDFEDATRRASRFRLSVRADPDPERLVPAPQRERGREEFLLVGAGTHPGAGVPGVLSSAKLLERVLATRYSYRSKEMSSMEIRSARYNFAILPKHCNNRSIFFSMSDP
jgi:phytoene desaturase